MENFKEKVVAGFAWQAVTKLVVQVLSWISTIWVARLLLPEDYGLVATAGIFTGFLMILASSGVTAALINAKELSKKELDSAYWFSFLLGGALYGVLLLIADSIGSFFEESNLSGLLAVAGLIIWFSALKTVPLVIALRKLEYKEVAFSNVIANLFAIVVTLTMAHMGYGFWSLVSGTLVAEVVGKIVLMIQYRYFPSLAFGKKIIRQIVDFGFRLTLNRIFMFCSNNLPVFYLSNSVGTQATGNYQFAKSLASMPSQKFGDLFTGLVFPVISRVKNEPELAKATFLRMHFYMLLSTGPMFVLLYLIAEPLVLLVLTAKWADAIYPFQLLCVVSIFMLSTLFITKAAEAFNGLSLSLYSQVVIFVGVAAVIALSYFQAASLDQMMLYYAIAYPLCYLFLAIKIKSLFNLSWGELTMMYLPLAVCFALMSVCYQFTLPYLSGFGEVKYIISAAAACIVYLIAALFICRQTLISDAKTLLVQIKESRA